MISVKGVEDKGSLHDWGLDGILLSLSKWVMFGVMTSRGAFSKMSDTTTLLICCAIDDAATQIVANVLPSFIPDMERRNSQAITWMTECKETHHACEVLGNGPLPTRILDLGPNNHTNQFKLRGDLAGLPDHYACLSYCWGSAQSTMTKSGTIDKFKRDINLASLLKTIQDAISVTRKLNLRYLWVDALCILQDDDEEKARECSKMDHIYQQAYVTIAAANAEDSHDGFLDKTQSIHDDLSRLPIVCPDGRLGSVFILPKKKNLFADPLQSRAWTLQEQVLSSQLLIWSKYQLFWLCTEGLKPEHEDGYALAGPYCPGIHLLQFDKEYSHDPDEPSLAKMHLALSGKSLITNGRYSFQFSPEFVHDEMQAL